MGSHAWRGEGIPDQSGRVAVVTGANSGIGYVTARELARYGAHTILACRDKQRGEAALERLHAELGEAGCGRAELVPLDLADLGSVRDFPVSLPTDRVDLLVNNAGVMGLPYQRTADGFEMQFGTNHLGHFALTGVLLPWLSNAAQPRVVTVSSNLHQRGRIDFDDLHSAGSYDKWRAYAQSKLANLLFADELQRRATAAGHPLLSMAAHPGMAATNLAAGLPTLRGRPRLAALLRSGIGVLGQSEEQGALPVLRAATDPTVAGGSYLGPARMGGTRGPPVLARRAPAACDEYAAEKLWRISADLTGVRYFW
ncbi:oxidoreductase [Salinactinospora qingdaonensis]|uniref:Oxidoreductase n=1 Tax=Salinactinospora qingdaonensis TaxID=702744 RepID=A0ABP7G9M2_9ACTN